MRALRYRLAARFGGQPPLPPATLRGGIGPGDFWLEGEAIARHLASRVDLPRIDRVLEIGSGLGRLAWPLSLRLPRRASYLGLDVSPAYVDWSRAVLPLPAGRFEFRRLDVASSQYNPGGGIAPEAVVLPVADAGVDLVIANSLLSHLLPSAIERYVAESRRVLRSGGRLYASAFVVDDGSLPRILARDSYPIFVERRENCWISDPAIPEAGVAVDGAWFLAALTDRGFAIDLVEPGSWRGLPAAPRYQDLILATAA
ncbi:MAG: class I SAM-dependent methyltransferase [Thermoanaerobaculia bacterium]